MYDVFCNIEFGKLCTFKNGDVLHLIQILLCGKLIFRTHKTDNKGLIYYNLFSNLKSDTRNYHKKYTVIKYLREHLYVTESSIIKFFE